MTKRMIVFGEWGEIAIDIEEIASVEGLADQAGGHVRTKKDGTPVWVATRISLKNGGAHVVPHTHDEVRERMTVSVPID